MILTETSAREKATKIAERLTKKYGMKWVINVWDNLGWCFFVYCELGKNAFMSVHPSHDCKSYFALASDLAGSGNGRWYQPETYEHPEEAVEAMITTIREETAKQLEYGNRFLKGMGREPVRTEE